MKVSMWLILIFASSAAMLTACSKDLLSDGGDAYTEAVGMVRGSQGAYDILLDNGKVLEIETNNVPTYPVWDGQRVLANYTLLEEKNETYEVQLNLLDSIRTKYPVLSSGYTESELDAEFGQDGIMPDQAWFSHDKFLTINFRVYRADRAKKHMISLILDEENTTDDKIVAEIRHNAYGDGQMEEARGLSAFIIDDWFTDGKDEITVELRWKSYSGAVNSVTRTFQMSTPAQVSKGQRPGIAAFELQ